MNQEQTKVFTPIVIYEIFEEKSLPLSQCYSNLRYCKLIFLSVSCEWKFCLIVDMCEWNLNK